MMMKTKEEATTALLFFFVMCTDHHHQLVFQSRGRFLQLTKESTSERKSERERESKRLFIHIFFSFSLLRLAILYRSTIIYVEREDEKEEIYIFSFASLNEA